MSKLLCVVSCPIDVYSGYSERSRDFVKSLIKLKDKEWDIRILSQRWGDCNWGYLADHNEQDLTNRIIPGLPRQPDIWFQITVPNEFQPVGKFNIGMTAGIETTICDPSWVEGVNRMNLVLVSSNHAKQVFQNSKFEKRDQQGNNLGIIEVKTPVEVLFEGLDLSKYYKTDTSLLNGPEKTMVDTLDSIPEKFCFLFVGHWMKGVLGEDRKNVGMTVKVFLETFKNKKEKPALILKTSGGISSIMDRDQILKRIDEVRKTVKGDLPNIYLLHGEVDSKDINVLYNHSKIKAMVNLTKGEGYGRPLLEFSIMQKPIIASGWSGHTDFLSPEFSLLVKGEVKQIHPSAVVPNVLIQESGWFTPDYSLVGIYMKDVFENYSNYLDKAKRQAYKTKTSFSLEKMEEKINELLTLYLPEFPKQVELNIPQLRKISLPKINEEAIN